MIIELRKDKMLGKPPDVNIEIFKERGWVSGGAIRRWFSGEGQNSDIDIFAKTESDYIEIKNLLDKICQPINTGNALTYGKIQLINFRFDNVESLLNWFDFSHCQFAWDGEKIYCTENAIISTLRRHLSVNNIHPEFAIDSLRRAFKYQRQGYTPCWGTLRDMAQSLQAITSEDINKQIEISPGGGKRVVMFD